MANNSDFKFLPTTGPISGVEMEKQLIAAINEVMNASTNAENNSKEAVSTANAAKSTSTNAENNSKEAVSTANAAKSTADGIDTKATNALDTANEALNTVTKPATATTLGQVIIGDGVTATAAGVLTPDFATNQEVIDGTSKIKVVNPATLRNLLDTNDYIKAADYATNEEALAGTATLKVISPGTLHTVMTANFKIVNGKFCQRREV